MAKPSGCLTDGELAYDNSSRMEPKRPHQWFMDGSEVELFPNKKQAVEVQNNTPFLGISNPNISPWGNASSFQSVSGHFTERLFDSEAARTINFDDRNNITSVSAENMNMGRKVIEDPFTNDSAFGLSMSHTLEDPRLGLNYGGIRKVKVSQVKDSENVMSLPMGHVFDRGDNSSISMAHSYNKAADNLVSMGLAYNNKGDDSIISIGDTYDREDTNNFISMGQPYNKGDDNISLSHAYKGNDDTMSMGHTYGKDDNNVISMGQIYNRENDMGHPFRKGDSNIISMGQTYDKENDSSISIGHPFSKGDSNIISMGQSYKENDSTITMSHSFSKGDSNIISMGQSYNKGSESVISMGHIYNKEEENAIPTSHSYNKRDNNNLSMGHIYSKGDSTIISFGGYDDDSNPSGRLISSYDLLMGQPSVQSSEASNEKELVESAHSLVGTGQVISSGTETVSKKKEDSKAAKKEPPNSFPSNVRSLLSTGMLDGVPVKYIAWSREKELRGVIKGSGYLCGCQSCNFSKAINAYEFERHAGCKTKHPNNHIYFENGKTIYGIVQELRSTPQNMLFDVIQTITGSPINQKSFRSWKDSFLAATRELQRIYGKDEGKRLS